MGRALRVPCLPMGTTTDLTMQQVQHVAALARLALTDEEMIAIGKDLKAILNHVDKLSEVDVTGVKPLASPHSHCSRLHDDMAEPPLAAKTVLDLAPATEGDFIAVPKVLTGGGDA